MLFTNKTYDSLKWFAQIALPAITTFIGVMMKIWNIAYSTEIVASLTALDTLLGALLGVSSKMYYKHQEEEFEADGEEKG